MRIALLSLGLLLAASMQAQNSVGEVLGQIENNNLTLKTLRMEWDATVVANKAGRNPDNPSVAYVYQWGKEEVMGTRSEFNITQSFDFPTAYIHRNSMVKNLNSRAEYDYKAAYNEVMLNAVLLCYRIVYTNRLEVEYRKRLDHAEGIDEAYALKLETGDVNIIERNKAKLNLLNVRNHLAVLQADLVALQQRLQGLNGGHELELKALVMPGASLPDNFDQWFSEMVLVMPQMQSLQEGLNASQRREQLNRALSYPKLSGGYSSEKGLTDEYRGLNIGLTIPLWENKNSVRKVALQTRALQNQIEDERIQALNGLRALYEKALRLQKTVGDYESTLDKMNSEELLKIALDAGEISILDYIVEQSIYYEAIENYAGVLLEYNSTLARMNYFSYQ